MSSLRVNKQRPPTKTGAIPLARRWAFTLRLLIPFPRLGSFCRSYVRSCRRSSAAGLAVQAGITGLQFGRNLSLPASLSPFPLSTLCHCSFPSVRTVRFESSNRCPLSLEPPAFKLCARRRPRVNISIKHRRSYPSVKVTRCLILENITSTAQQLSPISHNFSYIRNLSSIYRE